MEIRNKIVRNALGIRNASPISAHEATVLLRRVRKPVAMFTLATAGTLYYRALGEVFAVPDNETNRAAIAAIGSRALPVTPGKMVSNSCKSLNWSYRNKYQFFCVDPAMAAPCILSGWDYKEDAQDDAKELKEFNIPFKIVSRRFLEQKGIDPNDAASWKKNRS